MTARHSDSRIAIQATRKNLLVHQKIVVNGSEWYTVFSLDGVCIGIGSCCPDGAAMALTDFSICVFGGGLHIDKREMGEIKMLVV